MGKIIQFWASRLHAPLSPTGLLLGSAAFTAALTPSLIPRTGAVQGATAGLAFAVAYGLGVLLSLVWIWLGIAHPPNRHLLHLNRAIQACSALTILFGLGQASAWQQTIHQALGLPAVETARPFLIAISALGVALGLIVVGRLFRLLMDLYSLPLRHVFPKRLSLLAATVLAAWSFWAIGNGYLVSAGLRALDSTYRRIDALMPAEEGMPRDPLKTGSPASFISWESLGQEGRNRILSRPSNDDIASLGSRDWKQPLRVYVGLNSAETPQARAALALKELIRIGGFDRKLLVISTPTGTGWIDPAAMVPLEVLHKGDVTTVSVQYSYLPSWLSLLTEPSYGHETARALFTTVYQYWHALPKSARPELFLFGLSLGAMNSDLSADMFDIVDDPYHGAFWVGPPFASRTWNTIQASRTGGTPWLPDARNRKVFRFFTNSDRTQLYEPDWGPLRVLYLQYASDPIVFFETDVWRRPPTWLAAQHAPDISTDFRWIPGVTFLQTVVDMVLATTVPNGVGHVYSAADYTAGWLALTQPKGWDDNDLELLLRWLESKGL